MPDDRRGGAGGGGRQVRAGEEKGKDSAGAERGDTRLFQTSRGVATNDFDETNAASVFQTQLAVITARARRSASSRDRRAAGNEVHRAAREGRVRARSRPGEEAVLARMRQLQRKPRGRARLSYGAIAAALNAERLPTRTGAQWRAGTVRRILKRAVGAS